VARWQLLLQWMVDILDQQVGLESYAGPGHWNDPDMLEVGNGGMTTARIPRSLQSLAILAAPLIAGNDLRDMKPEIREILSTRVDCRRPGSARQRGRQGAQERRPGSVVEGVAGWEPRRSLFNRGTADAEIGVSWKSWDIPRT